MKIQASLRDLYVGRRPIIEALKGQVDEALTAGKPTRWHYESRVKELESFSVKIESGRFKRPADLEDFLACTIVVPNSASINAAIDWVKARFELKYRRPPEPNETKKRADSFPFDDLRMYCMRGNDGSRPEEPIDKIIFEVQIKTFLQHAWGIATHDLSYKTDDVRWGKDRIVAHLKAAIEFAEVTIQQAEDLSYSPALQLVSHRTKAISDVIRVLTTHWNRSDLPENLRGLAESLYGILDDLKLTADNLHQLLHNEKMRADQLPLNLSPYGVVIQLLLHNYQGAIEARLRNADSRFKLLITPEIMLPASFTPTSYPSRIVSIGPFI